MTEKQEVELRNFFNDCTDIPEVFLRLCDPKKSVVKNLIKGKCPNYHDLFISQFPPMELGPGNVPVKFTFDALYHHIEIKVMVKGIFYTGSTIKVMGFLSGESIPSNQLGNIWGQDMYTLIKYWEKTREGEIWMMKNLFEAIKKPSSPK